MRISARLAFLCLVSIASVPVAALSAEIGRVELDGRSIILNDDNTWTYADSGSGPSAAACTRIDSTALPVGVCLDPAIWERAELGGAPEHSFKVKNAERYLMLITEKDFFPNPTLRDAILKNAQSAAGLEKVKILDEGEELIGGAKFSRIVYRTVVDGLDVTYSNHYTGFVGKGSVQFVFFAESADNEAFAPEMAKVVSALVVGN